MSTHPLTMTASRHGRLQLFGLLYFVQGAIMAYVLIFNNLYLRQYGATAAQLSLLNGLLVVPFVLKIGIGLLSDRQPWALPLLGRGHRVPYMAMGLLLIMIGGIAAAFVPPVADYPLFLTLALLIAVGLALYDTTADGLAVDVTPVPEHELVQGAMMVGRALGFVIMAAVYGRLISAVNWQIVFWIVIAAALLPFPWLWRVQESPQRSEAQQFNWAALRELWRPEIGRFSLYAIVYSVAVYGTNAIITLFANEALGGTIVQVGDAAALGGLGMLIGSALAIFAGRHMPIWKLGNAVAALVSLTLVLIAFVANLANIATMTLLWGICLAAAELVFLTLAMAKTDPRLGAGQFAIFMAISNVGTGVGQAASTGLIDTVDFHWIFLGLAVINLLSFPLLQLMRADDQPVRELPETLPI